MVEVHFQFLVELTNTGHQALLLIHCTLWIASGPKSIWFAYIRTLFSLLVSLPKD